MLSPHPPPYPLAHTKNNLWEKLALNFPVPVFFSTQECIEIWGKNHEQEYS